MLEIKNPLLKKNGKTVLVPSMSFSIVPGEILCVSGENALSNTLLLKVLLGMQQLDGGFVTMDGDIIDGASVSFFRKMMAYVPHDVEIPYHSIAEITECICNLKVNKEKEFTMEMLFEEWQKLGLQQGAWEAEISALPAATIQLAMLSIAKILKCPYVLIDEIRDIAEPTLLANYLREMASDGVAIIVVSNNPVIRQISHKSLNMNEIYENINLI
ncbi:MAG: ATP-binding cassette domain-containing protein [Prevotella sp.]|nr:ATP-binding cassette domain-containing protein [Prevotella sp.]